MKLAIDVMGGDHAPQEPIRGAVDALKHVTADIVLVGDEAVIREELKQYTYDSGRIHIVHAPDVITNDDRPVQAIKTRKESSIVVGLEMLKKGDVDAFVSAGSTGALLAGGTLKLGRIRGIDRPALTIVYPTDTGISVLTDAGANTECKPRTLMQFAVMGSLYAELVLNISNPSVGLVNVGTEEGKGNGLVSEAYDLIKASDLNFYGNLEAREIPAGAVDVIVCDGFTGNVILKLSEGLVRTFSSFLKGLFGKSFFTKLAALVVADGLRAFKKKMDYTEYGGAPFLGTSRALVKAHGSSNGKAFMNALKYAERYVAAGVIESIRMKVELWKDAGETEEQE